MMMPVRTDFPAQGTEGETLPETFAPGWGLRARCGVAGCGATASIDPHIWLAQGLAAHSLERLETRLRCVCGARRARLEIAPQGPAT